MSLLASHVLLATLSAAPCFQTDTSSIAGANTCLELEQPKRDAALATLETMLFLGVGTAWYYIDYEQNAHDWDFEFSPDTVWKKLNGELLRFENNNFYHNALGHAVSGSFYYNAWRANGFTALESLAAATLTSSLWEFVFEWREVASINDLIVTPIGGFVVGEAFHQNATVLMSEDHGLLGLLLAAVMDSPLFFNQYPVQERPTPWHQIAFSMQLGNTRLAADDGPRPLARFSFLAEVFQHRSYGQRTRISRWFLDAPYTSFEMGVAFQRQPSVADVYLLARHAFVGYLHQVPGEHRGIPVERSIFVGLASSFEHDTYRMRDRTDRYGIIGLVGPLIDARMAFEGFQLAFTGEAYLDFAVVNALALDAYADGGSLEGTKSSIRDRGYYYGVGYTTRAEVTASYFGLTVGAGLQLHGWDSIDGRDRLQESVTRDFSIEDSRRRLTLRTSYVVIPDLLHLSLKYENNRIAGAIENTREVANRIRILGGVSLLL